MQQTSTDTKFSRFTELTTQQTREAVVQYQTEAMNTFGLPKSQIFIAFSSGILDIAERQNQMVEVDSLRSRLQGLNLTTHTIDYLTVKEEARLTLLGIVEASIRPQLYKAGIVDIGTGNVKGGYCINNNCSSQNFTYFNSGLSLGNLEIELPKNPDLSTVQKVQEYAEQARKLILEKTIPQLTDQFTATGIINKEHIFLTGGTFWAALGTSQPRNVFENTEENYIRITHDDIRRFKDLVISDFKTYAAYSNASQFPEKTNEGLRRIAKAFYPAKAIIAAILAEEILRVLERSPIPKTYTWYRYSDTGWPTGYIIKSID